MFLLISVLFPILAAVIVALCRKAKRTPLLVVSVLLQAVETALLVAVLILPKDTLSLFSVSDKISFALSSDETAKFFCALVACGWLLVMLYSTVYMKHEKNEPRFYICMFLSETALVGAALSSGLVSMYVFYELLTLCSMPLVLHTETKESIRAAMKYLFYSIAGAFMALFGIFVLSTAAPTLEFTVGGVGVEGSPLVLTACLLLSLGFGAKAGLYPLHGWLPTAHPVAPAPASALLSALIAKAGVLAIIRSLYFVVGTETLRGTWVQTTLLILALATILIGSTMAYREKVLKKRLAFSTVSQISYVLVGLFLFTDGGVKGALLQVTFHAAVKTCLFLCAGAIIYLTGKTQIDEIYGIGRRMPVIMVAYTVAALSLIGIPPMGGFVSKWTLATSALEGVSAPLSYIIPIVLLVSALLTAGYLLQISVRAFYPGPARLPEFAAPETKKEPLLLCLPIIVLAVFALLGGVLSGTTLSVAEAIKDAIL
ncbi:MAG: proton-conducting membrane transporter [Clostridia bacterium]|nr:proton-conducting membrane transporter [Clostridia bacterium]